MAVADMRSDDGFTLVEVLTALSVFSIAALAMINLSNETAAGVGHADKRFLAEVEASTVMTDAFLEPGQLSPGQTAGEMTQRGRILQWSRIVLPTERSNLVRIEVSVTDPETGQVLATLQSLRRVTNDPS